MRRANLRATTSSLHHPSIGRKPLCLVLTDEQRAQIKAATGSPEK
jgi:hypothetical protein